MLTPELCSRCYDLLTGFSAASELPTVLYHGHIVTLFYILHCRTPAQTVLRWS
jgi:hypothetical protein